MTQAFDAAPRQVTGEVEGLGRCVVRRPTLAVERVLAGYYSEDGADASAFVDALLSHTAVSPGLSYDDAAALPTAQREGLRRLVRSVCELPGDSPVSDAALLIAMRGRHQRLTGQAQATSTGFAAWLADVIGELRERVHAAARGTDVGAAIERWARRAVDVGAQADAIVAFYEQEPLGFVVSDVRFERSFELLFDAVEQGEEVLVTALDRALLDGEFLAHVRAEVHDASFLDAQQQDELLAGLEHLQGRRWAPSCRLVMAAVEGIVWDAARREGVVNDRRELLRTAAPGRPRLRLANSVNALLDERCGLELEDDFRLFLDDQLWDGPGQDLRHGRIRGPERAYALWALIALCGVLDRESQTRLMYEVGERIDASIDAEPGATSA